MGKIEKHDYRKEHCVTNLIGNVAGTAHIFWLKPPALRAGKIRKYNCLSVPIYCMMGTFI